MYNIYCDSEQEGYWFKSLIEDFAKTQIKKIEGRNKNPYFIEKYLRYDRPDVILTKNNTPVLVFEKTSEVPTGHNVGQRFGRIANSAEEKAMFIKFFPFDARKHGKYSSLCNLNIRLLDAFFKMMEIHKVPILAMNWPCDKNYELIRDGSEDNELRNLLEELFEKDFDLNKVRSIKSIRRGMKREYNRRLKEFPNYGKPPRSVSIQNTEDIIKRLKTDFKINDDDLPQIIFRREETLVYTNKMTPQHCRREDPYIGTQFIYDYIWCRNGPKPDNKFRNLFLRSPLITKKRWLEANPFDRNRKSSTWYVTADAIILKDAILTNFEIFEVKNQTTKLSDFW